MSAHLLIGDQLSIVREDASRREPQFENVDHNATENAYDFVKSLSAPRSAESRGSVSTEYMGDRLSLPLSVSSKLSQLSSGKYNEGDVDHVIRAPFDMDYKTMMKSAII